MARLIPLGRHNDANTGLCKDRFTVVLPSMSMGSLSAAWILRTQAIASSVRVTSSSKTVNSSPPNRATVSSPRRQVSNRSETSISNWSPAICPKLSLITLKPFAITGNRPSIARKCCLTVR